MTKYIGMALVVCVLAVGGSAGPGFAFDLGNGFSISNVTYMDFTAASGDLFDKNTGKDITPAQAKTNEGQANGFHLNRFYITLVKQVNDQLLIRLTSDQMTARPDGSTEATPFGFSGYGGAGRGNFFIKYGYAQYTPFPQLMIRAGMNQTAWIDEAENRWTLRFLRPTFWDEQGALTSSDLGVSAIGNFFNKLIGYHLMFSNGEGYENNSIDGRGFAGQGRLDLNPIQGLTLSAFGLMETYHNGVSGWNPNREIFYAMYAQEHDLFRVAAEYMMADDVHSGSATKAIIMTTPGVGSSSGSRGPSTSGPRFDQARGYGAWGWVRIPGAESLRLFTRFYVIKPNTTTAAGKTAEINGGVAYDVMKGITVAVDETYIDQRLLMTSGPQIQSFVDNVIGVRALLTF